jgi:hypothetical protein
MYPLAAFMTRCSVFAVLLLLLVVASEAGKLGLLSPDDVSLGNTEGNNVDHGNGSSGGGLCLEKTIKCKGGFIKEMGGCVMCEGGIKGEFHKKQCKAEDISHDVDRHLKNQIHDTYMEDKELFAPDEEAVDALKAFDNAAFVAGLENGSEHKVKFGGFMAAWWGCEVTITKTEKGIEKQFDCGGKFHKGHGEKPSDEELALFEKTAYRT